MRPRPHSYGATKPNPTSCPGQFPARTAGQTLFGVPRQYSSGTAHWKYLCVSRSRARLTWRLSACPVHGSSLLPRWWEEARARATGLRVQNAREKGDADEKRRAEDCRRCAPVQHALPEEAGKQQTHTHAWHNSQLQLGSAQSTRHNNVRSMELASAQSRGLSPAETTRSVSSKAKRPRAQTSKQAGRQTGKSR